LTKVVVGGTFDFFHKGHRMLLLKAIESGEEIMVGITSDEMAEKQRGYKVNSFEERKEAVEKVLKAHKVKYEIIMIKDPCGRNDKFGSAADENYDVIVVSPETKAMAEKINDARVKKGNKPMKVVQIPCYLAEDQKSISSKRIRRGVIDEEGRVKGEKKTA
jgi:cytidyltransferase-like protein